MNKGNNSDNHDENLYKRVGEKLNLISYPENRDEVEKCNYREWNNWSFKCIPGIEAFFVLEFINIGLFEVANVVSQKSGKNIEKETGYNRNGIKHCDTSFHFIALYTKPFLWFLVYIIYHKYNKFSRIITFIL